MLTIDGAVSQPHSLSLSELQHGFPQHTVNTHYANDERNAIATYTGALLWDVLQAAQPILNPNQPALLRVMARSRDGFRCIVQWEEIDPTADNKLILVGWLQNGQPLNDQYGPLRLVVPGDQQGLRYIRRLASVTILNKQGSDE